MDATRYQTSGGQLSTVFITPYRSLLSFQNISPIIVRYVNNFLELTPWVSTKSNKYQSISDNSLRLWVSGLCLPLLDFSLNLLFVMINIKKLNYMYSTCKKQYTCISLVKSICNSCMDNSEIARYLHFIVLSGKLVWLDIIVRLISLLRKFLSESVKLRLRIIFYQLL